MAFTEKELTPTKEVKTVTMQSKMNWYPGMGRKKIDNPDEIHAIILPMIVQLNKGKSIEPNSMEHKELKDLLKRLDK